jgi:hypothetical protein
VESFYRFFAEVIPAVQIQQSSEDLNIDRHFRVFTDMIRKYFDDRSLIPEHNLFEVRFEDFKKDPISGLREIYSRLNLPGFEEAMPFFESYQAEQSEYNQHKWEISSQTISLVNQNAADILEKLGYPVRAQSVSPTP